MPRTEPLRSRIDLSAYPSATVTERGRQQVIVRYRDLYIEVRAKPLTGPGGVVEVRSWFTKPELYWSPAPLPQFSASAPSPLAQVQARLEEHLGKVSPLELLADTLPDDERQVDLPVVIRLTPATRTAIEEQAKLSGADIGGLIGEVLDRVIPSKGWAGEDPA